MIYTLTYNAEDGLHISDIQYEKHYTIPLMVIATQSMPMRSTLRYLHDDVLAEVRNKDTNRQLYYLVDKGNDHYRWDAKF
ncbi:MAG: hypothetical protein IKN47_00770 [Lachnospiraceae bacterium]|nr:hypothetical protein [Lachnospiraceae bacterium]